MNNETVLQDEGMTVDNEAPTTEDTSVHEGVEETSVQEPTAEPVATEASPEVERLREELAAMEQKYRSLAGVARAKDQQLEEMRKLLEELSASVKAQEERSRPSPLDEVVTPSDVENLGEDTVSFVRRVAETAIKSVTDKLEQRIAKLEEQINGVSQVATASAEQQFMQQLDRVYPKWRELNVDPEFIEWLQASPSRMQSFQAAGQALDADGVATFFRAYAAEKGIVDEPKTDRKRKNVAPGKSKAAGSRPAGQEKKIWTRAEIAQVYANRQKYSAQEFQKLERDIFQAQQEGRIQL